MKNSKKDKKSLNLSQNSTLNISYGSGENRDKKETGYYDNVRKEESEDEESRTGSRRVSMQKS